MSHVAEWNVKRIEDKLVGATITNAVTDNAGSFGFAVETPDGKRLVVWVDGDEEGNHCGALNIEELEEGGPADPLVNPAPTAKVPLSGTATAAGSAGNGAAPQKRG